MNLFAALGLPDVHDLARRVLVGDVGSVRRAARSAADAGARVVTQADAVIRERDRLRAAWTGAAADEADRALTGHESALRAQARQLVAGSAVLDEAGDALGRVQDTARRIEDAATAMQGAFESGLAVQPGAAGAALVAEFLAPLRADAVVLATAMAVLIRDYQAALRARAVELAAESGVVRPDAGPLDVGSDAMARRTAQYRAVFGTDPVTQQDWSIAAMLDAHSGDPRAAELPANIVVARIEPVPGAGVVHGDAFIATAAVIGAPLFPVNRGDARSFDPHAGPERSRASFVIDYERGVVLVRQNPSHDELSGVSLNGDPVVGVEQDAAGRVRLRLDAANPLAPDVAANGGWSVRGDLVVDPRGGPSGRASVDGVVSQYPSWEVYQSRADAAPVPLLRREQNFGDNPLGPAVNLPLDTTTVGRHPERLDDWLAGHHPEQRTGPLEDLIEQASPVFAVGDPWYDNPLPATPYPAADGSGTVRVPAATPVG